MKLLPKILLTLAATLVVTTTHANTNIGIGIGIDRNYATFYKSSPQKWHDNRTRVDCLSIKRIKGGPRINGVVFFSAQTFNKKHHAPGKRIVVAVLERNVHSFTRKYCTVRTSHKTHRTAHISLHGVFRILDDGQVYLDVSGHAHKFIFAYKNNSKRTIIHGEDTRKDRYRHWHHRCRI